MKEIKAIIEAFEKKDKDVQCALAIVVRVEGSSYRRTGARMLVCDDGTWVGGISGGCLEGDALKRAKLAIYQKTASIITYDTSRNDEQQIGVGLGCNGIIDVLFCPIDESAQQHAIHLLKNCIDTNRKTNVLVTVMGLNDKEAGFVLGHSQLYIDAQSLEVFGTYGPALEQLIEQQLQVGHSAPHKLERSADAYAQFFIEILAPEIHLMLFGFQYDIFPLSKLASELGYAVSIVANPLKVNPKVKQLAKNVLPVDDLPSQTVDAYTAAILMSHDYNTDKNNLKTVLEYPFRYIGLLGPKVRSEKIFKELAEENFEIGAENFERIYAPVGLDIGAVSPEEIALSLLSEIRAVFSGRSGASLRKRSSPIHERKP